jgi:integrase
MMPNQKLTGVRIATLKPLSGQARTQYFDSAYPGLCLRVGLRDKSWCYYFRFNGRKQYKSLGKYAIGRTDHMDRAAAIKAADEIEKTIEKGINPTATPIRVVRKPTVKNPNAFTRRVQQFLIYYERQVKPKTFVHASGLLTGSHVTSITNSDIDKISRSQIVELLEGMHATPVQANRLQAYLSKFFGWCWDREYCDPSPMVRLQKRFKEKPRKRHLSSDEIKDLWKGCIELGYPLGSWCLFTLATGQRPGECRNLSHDDIHDDIWLVEGGDPKNDERHRIPLPKIARDIIKDAPELEGPFVFSTAEGHKPFSQGGKPYRYLYEAADLNEPWRPHDLRRTFQTLASEELDIEPHLLGAISNQISVAKPGVSNVYNQAKWMKPKEKVLEAWNRWLLEAVQS